MVLVPGDWPDHPARTLLLVEDGKFGASPRVERLLDGRESSAVRVAGTVLRRDAAWILELAEGETGMRMLTAEEELRLPSLASPEVAATESVALKGEIIDPKCYLGAMRPGGGKTHKACAMLCISGGIPPMLVTRDCDRGETFYLLAAENGGPASEQVLPFVGDSVEVAGRLKWRGDLRMLLIAPKGVRRR